MKFFGNNQKSENSVNEEVKSSSSAENEKSSDVKKTSEVKEKRTLTVFGSETEFDGVLEFNDDLIITGKFNGKIKATGNLEISKNAVCTVESIEAESIIVAGDLTGNVIAQDRIEICSGASVTGDLTAARLRIANNVEFEGQVTMLDSEPDSNIFSSASNEYKQALVGSTDIIE